MSGDRAQLGWMDGMGDWLDWDVAVVVGTVQAALGSCFSGCPGHGQPCKGHRAL